jgi:hypothetical protein
MMTALLILDIRLQTFAKVGHPYFVSVNNTLFISRQTVE